MRKLVSLLVLFAALAVFYSVIVPLFEGPDEDDHFRYAKFIADYRALPVQAFERGGGVAGHQGWQPPLYYTLVALVIAPIDTSDYGQHLWRNDAATFVGDPSCCGRNLYYHTDSEAFPFTRTTLAVHFARLLSILFGAVMVAATYRLVATLFPRQSIVALASAAFVAFNPSFLFSSALVSNDVPLAALSTLVLVVWVEWLVGQRAATLKSAGFLGVLLSVALLIKTTALGLIPFSMLVLLVVAWRKRDWRIAIVSNAVMLVVVVLLSGWWFARDWFLYGDPIAYRLMTISAIFPRAGPLTLAELFQISLPWLWQTFWGGPTPGDFSPALLVALAVLIALSLVGVVIYVLRFTNHVSRIALAFLATWLAFILVAQIQFIQTTTGADQGRYLFPALAAIALFFVIGLCEVAARVIRNSQSGTCWLVTCVFFLLACFVPFAYTLPAYARPALLSENELTRVPQPLQINFADQIDLLGYDVNARILKPNDTLHVTLYWRARAPISKPYRVFVHLIGKNDQSVGGADVIPARGAFPTVYWKPGDALRDVVRIPIVANAPAGKYEIEVGLYPVGQPGERLPVMNSGDDRAIVDTVKILPMQAQTFMPQNRLAVEFGDAIELRGYDAGGTAGNVQLTFYWRAQKNVGEDYTVFVHALDAQGNIVAQKDQPPQAGNNPTALWIAGEEIRDEYVLTLSPGEYRIAIGLYRPDTGARLPVGTGDHIEFSLTVK